MENQSRALIHQLVERKVLLRIEEKLAFEVCPESAPLFCALLALGRLGHLCLEIGAMYPLLQSLISEQLLLRQWEEEIKKIPQMTTPSIHYFEGRFYLPKYWRIEEQLVHYIREITCRKVTPISPICSEALTEEQQKAVIMACHHPFSLITGGPGTGKTSVALEIARAFASSDRPFIALAAPTGKATSHLASKIAGLTPYVTIATLHSLLGVKQTADLYEPKEEPIPAGLLIVDEGSMIDPPLFTRLLSAIGPQTQLVIMGDANQLPAVEGGAIFADLIASGLPSETLTKVFRSDQQEILLSAQNILNGLPITPNLNLGLAEGSRVQFYENLWKHVQNLFPNAQPGQVDPEALLNELSYFRILSPLRRGVFGVDRINAFLKERFLAAAKHREFLPIPIMISQNDKQTGLANGQTGILIQHVGGDAIAYFSEGKSFPLHVLPPFEEAYCLSVHKSQGSEYPHVLLLIPESSEFFGREILYTGVTRAKKKLEIEGDPEVIAQAIQHTSKKRSGIVTKLHMLQIPKN